MRSISPRIDGCDEVTVAEEQLEYKALTAAQIRYTDGSRGLMTRWRLTPEEREAIANGADLYLGILTMGKPLQPISLEVGRPGWMGEEA